MRGALQVVGQVALALFMFTVGWSLDTSALRRHERTAAAISLSSALVPFALGIAIAVPLHRAHAVVGGEAVDFLPFALFIGASMSITAFPVLARILVDRGMARGRLGALVLTAAAVDDVLGWTLVVLVLAVLASAGAWECGARRHRARAVRARAARRRTARPRRGPSAGDRRMNGADRGAAAALLVAGTLACAGVTELIGVHFVIGAFAFGLVLPRRLPGAVALDGARGPIVAVAALLLPAYFVLPGLNVDVTSLTGGDVGELAAIFALACLGKIGGAVAAARARRVGWHDALSHRSAHEHPRAHRARGADHRLRAGRARSAAVHGHGADGDRHHPAHRAAAEPHPARRPAPPTPTRSGAATAPVATRRASRRWSAPRDTARP